MTLQSSIRGGRVQWDVSYAEQWEGIDPYIRDAVVANNVLHCSDMASRVLVNDVRVVGAGTNNITTTVYSNAYWAPVAVYGPLVICTREVPGGGARAYSLRCALAASGAGVEFAIEVCDTYSRALSERTLALTPPNGTIHFGTATVSASWLTPSHPLLNVQTWSYLSLALPPVPGDPPVNVTAPCVWLRVIAKGVDQPYVHAVHVAEVYA